MGGTSLEWKRGQQLLNHPKLLRREHCEKLAQWRANLAHLRQSAGEACLRTVHSLNDGRLVGLRGGLGARLVLFLLALRRRRLKLLPYQDCPASGPLIQI